MMRMNTITMRMLAMLLAIAAIAIMASGCAGTDIRSDYSVAKDIFDAVEIARPGNDTAKNLVEVEEDVFNDDTVKLYTYA